MFGELIKVEKNCLQAARSSLGVPQVSHTLIQGGLNEKVHFKHFHSPVSGFVAFRVSHMTHRIFNGEFWNVHRVHVQVFSMTAPCNKENDSLEHK